MNTVMSLLEELEREIKAGKRSMMSGNRVIDEYRVLDIISAIKDVLPNEIVAANAIVRDKGEVVASAQAQADKIIRDANEQAKRLVSQSAVVEQAARDADEIIADANKYGKHIIAETKAALNSLFKDAEITLTSILRNVTECREEMQDELNTTDSMSDGYVKDNGQYSVRDYPPNGYNDDYRNRR